MRECFAIYKRIQCSLVALSQYFAQNPLAAITAVNLEHFAAFAHLDYNFGHFSIKLLQSCQIRFRELEDKLSVFLISGLWL